MPSQRREHVSAIRVIQPCGQPHPQAMARNLTWLREHGFDVDDRTFSQKNSVNAFANDECRRAEALNDALIDESVEAIFAARGGYGASDLLPRLDWERLQPLPGKPLVGFSDVTAIHSALYTRLGWCGVHGPMPGSPLFGQHDADVTALVDLLTTPLPWQGQLSVNEVTGGSADGVSGRLFGGCLAVLTNLIGTPWFPKNLRGMILFLEDTDESPSRIGRYWAQWQQSGAAAGIAAVVLGNFTKLGDAEADNEKLNARLHQEIIKRCECPVYTSSDFGHVSPNFPLITGADAQIRGKKLTWELTRWRVS